MIFGIAAIGMVAALAVAVIRYKFPHADKLPTPSPAADNVAGETTAAPQHAAPTIAPTATRTSNGTSFRIISKDERAAMLANIQKQVLAARAKPPTTPAPTSNDEPTAAGDLKLRDLAVTTPEGKAYIQDMGRKTAETVTNCASAQAQHGAPLVGLLNVSYHVVADHDAGLFSDIDIKGSDPQDDGLLECITTALYGVELPAPTDDVVDSGFKVSLRFEPPPVAAPAPK